MATGTNLVKIFCCQHDIVWENKPANFAKARALIASAAPPPGSLLVLAEMFATGFSLNVPLIAEGRTGETTAFLAGLAREHGMFVLGGVVTAAGHGRGRNEAVVFAPDGREIARYAKMQPFTPGGEAQHYEAGDRIVTFDWHGFTVAPFICYDLRFPELFRLAVARGANLFPVIASWPVARIHHWITLLQARAIENQAYFVGVNRCGRDPRFTYTGQSLVASFSGEVLARAEDGEKMISAEVDLKELQTYRSKLPFLQDIQPRRLGTE